MSEATWTWLLFAAELVGMSGMVAVGRRHWWGWVVVLVHSVPWFVYAIGHDKPGFVAMSGLWWTVNALNAWRWFSEARESNAPVRRGQTLPIAEIERLCALGDRLADGVRSGRWDDALDEWDEARRGGSSFGPAEFHRLDRRTPTVDAPVSNHVIREGITTVDIVTQLRDWTRQVDPTETLQLKAADEIEALREKVADLRAFAEQDACEIERLRRVAHLLAGYASTTNGNEHTHPTDLLDRFYTEADHG